MICKQQQRKDDFKIKTFLTNTILHLKPILYVKINVNLKRKSKVNFFKSNMKKSPFKYDSYCFEKTTNITLITLSFYMIIGLKVSRHCIPLFLNSNFRLI